jgi:hypothetical protein
VPSSAFGTFSRRAGEGKATHFSRTAGEGKEKPLRTERVAGDRNGRRRGTPASRTKPDRDGHGFGNDKTSSQGAEEGHCSN